MVFHEKQTASCCRAVEWLAFVLSKAVAKYSYNHLLWKASDPQPPVRSQTADLKGFPEN